MTPRGISERNRRLVTELHRATTGPFTADDAARVLGLPAGRTHRFLAYLAAQGWLTRVRQGLYATVPLEARQPEEWRQDPWVVAAKLFAPLYVGGWSACEHWGLTEQLFRVTVVYTARPVRARHVSVQGFTFWLRSIGDAKLFGTRSAWHDQIPVPVSDPSRTVVDLLDDPGAGGGIRHVSDVLRTYMLGSHRDDRLLMEYAHRLGNRTVFKRLGYLLEVMNLDGAGLVEDCFKSRSAGVSLLDPTLPKKGRVVRRWNLLLNASLEAGEPA